MSLLRVVTVAIFLVTPSTHSVIYSKKLCPLFAQILIMYLKWSFLRLPLIAKRCVGDEDALSVFCVSALGVAL